MRQFVIGFGKPATKSKNRTIALAGGFLIVSAESWEQALAIAAQNFSDVFTREAEIGLHPLDITEEWTDSVNGVLYFHPLF